MSTHENTATEKPDVYRTITGAFGKAIESGSGQYRMPWAARQDRRFSPIPVGSAEVAA
jgi:hypothetical protein